jgi:hypothetical protein
MPNYPLDNEGSGSEACSSEGNLTLHEESSIPDHAGDSGTTQTGTRRLRAKYGLEDALWPQRFVFDGTLSSTVLSIPL